jgi:2,5-diketo-D-gluconate reductase A
MVSLPSHQFSPEELPQSIELTPHPPLLPPPSPPGCADAECALPEPANFSSCGPYVEASMATWLQLGGSRLDNSASYHNQLYVGTAMAASGLPRSSLFLTSKVGPYLALGGAEAKAQFQRTLSTTGAGYVDLLLIHWPDCTSGGGCSDTPTSEPACQFSAPTYDERACRLATWKALVEIWQAGGARAIGVSNYNTTHLQEIIDSGMPLPAVNQVPFNLYHSRDLEALLPFMAQHKILYNGYSPFGVPDRRSYKPPMAASMLQDPVLLQVAAAHQRSPAEVTLAWQWAHGIVVNPRSQNAAHMLQNLGFWDISLSAAEVAALDSRPQY